MSIQNSAADQHENRVYLATQFFISAAKSDEVQAPQDVSEAAFILSLNDQVRLSPEDRQTLHYAIFSAAEQACVVFPTQYPREQIRRGFRAFAQLVDYWADDKVDRAAWGDRIADARDTARVLRNDCHNMSLRNAIADRAHKRRGATISALRTGT